MTAALEAGRYPRCMKRALDADGVIVEERPQDNCTDCPLSAVYKDRGAMTVRLNHAGRTLGVLSVSVPVHFLENAEERSLLTQVSSDIAFALHGMEIEQEQIRLQRSLALANIIVENSRIIRFRWKAQAGWPVEFVSRNISRFGYSPEDFLSGKIQYPDIIHPEDLDRVAREVQQHTCSGESHFSQAYRIAYRRQAIKREKRDLASGVSLVRL